MEQGPAANCSNLAGSLPGHHCLLCVALPRRLPAGRVHVTFGKSQALRDRPMSMTHPPTEPAVPPPVRDDWALAVYILYLAALVFGLTSIAGVIVAYVKIDTADPVTASHYRFQIRTFWISVLYWVVGGVLALVLVGFAILAWWFIWYLIRNIKGILALNENRPIANPTSWMFG